MSARADLAAHNAKRFLDRAAKERRGSQARARELEQAWQAIAWLQGDEPGHFELDALRGRLDRLFAAKPRPRRSKRAGGAA